MASHLFARYVQPRGFILLTVLLCGSIGLQILIPQVTRQFIDAASRPHAPLMQLGGLFLMLALLQQFVTVSAAYFGEQIAWNATNQLRTDLVQHCLNLDMNFHHQHSPGMLIERVDSDVTELANFFSQLFIRVGGNLMLMVGILGWLAWEDWRLGLAFSAFSVASLLLLYRFRHVAIPHEKRLRETETHLFGFLEERLAGLDDLRANGAATYTVSRLLHYHDEVLQRWRTAGLMQTIIYILSGLVMTAGYALAFVLGYTFFRSGTMTLGMVYLLMNYANLLNRPFMEITFQLESLQKIGASLERVSELLQTRSPIVDTGMEHLPGTALHVQFEQVNFSYGHTAVLHDLTFEVEPGKIVGVLGRTGSGKTTLARLLVRLYETEGIRLHGLDIRNIALQSLRQQVAYVTQDVQLFEGTLRDNLTLFDVSIPDETLLASIQQLGMAAWYSRLPQGLETPIEAQGKNLSAGEAQLLAFIRVFLRQPGLIILDEATARLDPQTQQVVEQALDQLLAGRTTFIIAHRLETIQRADYILILENGRLLEWGERQILARQPHSHFYYLTQAGEVLA